MVANDGTADREPVTLEGRELETLRAIVIDWISSGGSVEGGDEDGPPFEGRLVEAVIRRLDIPAEVLQFRPRPPQAPPNNA